MPGRSANKRRSAVQRRNCFLLSFHSDRKDKKRSKHIERADEVGFHWLPVINLWSLGGIQSSATILSIDRRLQKQSGAPDDNRSARAKNCCSKGSLATNKGDAALKVCHDHFRTTINYISLKFSSVTHCPETTIPKLVQRNSLIGSGSVKVEGRVCRDADGYITLA